MKTIWMTLGLIAAIFVEGGQIWVLILHQLGLKVAARCSLCVPKGLIPVGAFVNGGAKFSKPGCVVDWLLARLV